ncbi:MAG: hypothetical protein NVSMB24_28470 [Mucilaginibacter sp.]
MFPIILNDMNKMKIECPTCGSEYELTSQRTGKMDSGAIACYVCENLLFGYEGYVSYCPLLLSKKENHLLPKFPVGNLAADNSSDVAE